VTQPLYSVWGTGATDVWAVGVMSFLRWNGIQWTTQPSSIPGVSTDIWGSGASNVWAAGFTEVYKWNGTTWNGLGCPAVVNSLWTPAAGEAWAVGNNGGILHYKP
jgi:hypothetical protein